ncbi:DNA/RNA-binding protein KIN17 [Kwoniella heveanensis BCC8398]|uniref:DNA/RNA-binding protein KIN17 n=1 Tax=Kwoniella heveanensis BCC8398 TaxID=1296120 RepID=A0A1B9GTV6_9TREE|nr:DNA/RNA-binding protein KIN17 [Kwoniella heveanensis BCC8398]
MGKAEAGSTKAIANAIKAKGLGRLRWYCQVCEKQCRDENGFQAHCRSEPHMRKIMLVGPKAGNAISEYSRQFRNDFLLLLRTRHQTNRVRANAVYNEYIQDKHHTHMNATQWVTLSGFIQTLGKEGVVHVDEDEKGIWITWVDNRPETLARQAAAQKKDRATMDGEERERKMLEEQIARARAQAESSGAGQQEAGLQKKEGEKITLNLFGAPSLASDDAKPDVNGNASESPDAEGKGDKSDSADAKSSTPISFSTTTVPTNTNLNGSGDTKPNQPKSSFGTFSTSASKPALAPISNPLKRPAPMNVFKSAKMPKNSSDGEVGAGGGGGKKFMSEAERLMKEDQARKAGGGGGYRGFGPSRGGR